MIQKSKKSLGTKLKLVLFIIGKKISLKFFSPEFLDPENLGLSPFPRTVYGLSPKLHSPRDGGGPLSRAPKFRAEPVYSSGNRTQP